MQTETEAKWLNINHDNMRQKLRDIGAKLEQPERLMKRRILDYPGNTLGKIGGWVRVRDEGDKITLSYKQLNDRSVHGTKEITVVVNDFDGTCNFLETIGLRSKSYQETKRESWSLDEAQIELDTWPWIPSLLEIEARDEQQLKCIAQKLDLDYSHALHGSVETAYQAVYDVTEEEVTNWKEVTFVDVPQWLLDKTK